MTMNVLEMGGYDGCLLSLHRHLGIVKELG